MELEHDRVRDRRASGSVARLPLILAALLAIAVAGYWGVWKHGFVYDDLHYVVENPRVQGGLDGETVAWAFTSFDASNWHPLTWLSHALDHALFGLEPAGHHAVNLLLHAVNGMLLMLALRLMTGAVWRSAIVAALFAVHPLHVESVAWVAERKDVLSTLFLLLTLMAYTRFAQRRSVARYLAFVLPFLLGLLAKPMLVTLPCLLLLLDYWPLRRVGREPWSRLLQEKLPLLALSLASSVITVAAQKTGALAPLDGDLSLGVRVANAAGSYVSYMAKAVFPVRLSVFYPHPGASVSWLRASIAMLLLAAATAAIWRVRRRAPCLFVGWFWYLGLLVPVIGVVQVGRQALADRYTYVPLIGLFVALVWSVEQRVRDRADLTRLARVAAVAGVIALTALTSFQVRHWKNAESLFGHALELDPANYVAHNVLGMVDLQARQLESARDHFEQAVRLRPDYAEAHYNLAVALAGLGRHAESAAAYGRCLELRPDHGQAHTNLGALLASAGRLDAAIRHFRLAIESAPEEPRGYVNLGIALQRAGRAADAAAAFREALEIDPADEAARAGLARLSGH